MLHVQMQVQVLPVATAITLVCKYVVKYHGEYNFTKEFSCGTQTAPVFPTVLNLQQAYASSANHHGVSAQRRL